MTAPRPSGRSFAAPALLLANVVLACGPLLVRLSATSGGVGPVAAGFWRLVLTLPILLIAARARDGVPPLPRPALTGMVGVAGLAFAADLGFWHVGILHTRLANATLFGNVTALLYPLYGFFVARAWPRQRQWLALAMATAGLVLLLGRSYELSPRYLLGDLLCLLAGLCYTGYLICLDRLNGQVGPFATLALSALSGAPVLLLFAWGLGEPIWPHAWWPLVALAAGSQIIGQGLILYAVRRVSPLLMGLMLLVQPVVSALTGWIVYGEALGVADAAGAACVILAMLLVRERRDKALPAPASALKSGA